MARSELGTRVVTALLLAPVAVAAGWFGDWALAAFLSIMAALASWEFFRIARAGGAEPLEPLGIAIAAALPLLVHASRLQLFTLSLGAGAVAFLAIFGAAVVVRGPSRKPLGAVATTLMGIVYTGGMLSFGYALRYHPYTFEAAAGAAVLLLPVLLTWTADTGAYFVGRRIGRRKLIPSVSPGKSVEGALGGLVLAMLVAWAYQRWVLVPLAHFKLMPGAIFLFGAAIAVAAVVGDLAESLIKREAGVKDASHIIPGHGGVLDRIDSILFVLPTAYWLLSVLRLVPVVA